MISSPTISASRRETATCSAPKIVAEALVAVPDPVRTLLHPGPPAPAANVAASIAGALAPPRASAEAPPWLYADQRYAFERALAALSSFRAAMLAGPVGSGKTYIGLAVASAWQRGPVACLMPAVLRSQWEQTARRLGVPIVPCTHEAASRGRMPVGTRGLVLVDESQHYRHASIARYGHLADFLVGRPALLLSATPVVNNVGDLAHQLRLALRDDALACLGLPSMAALNEHGGGALGAVVVDMGARRAPARDERTIVAAHAAEDVALLTGIEDLALSSEPRTAALIRSVLLRALASSPAALAASLQRYGSMLRHAADARAVGRQVNREQLRAWTGGDGEQLVWWQLAPDSASTELVLEDAAAVAGLAAAARDRSRMPDGKLRALEEIISDRRRTIVFTSSRETVSWIRRHLPRPIAWCTGAASGVGGTSVPRDAVLALFRPGAPDGLARVLVTTDVAAEGLDLQGAERVIHYDLPWTATRLEQRTGRAARDGSPFARVSVLRFDPPPAVEQRLRQIALLLRSARAPGLVGIGRRELWSWRDEAAAAATAKPVAGVAGVVSSDSGALVGVALTARDAPPGTLASAALWIDTAGCRDDSARVTARLGEACRGEAREPDAGELTLALDRASGAVGALLRQAYRARWAGVARSAAARRVGRRIERLLATAARQRDAAGIARLERSAALLAGGLTAGEERLITALLAADDQELMAALARLPARMGPPSGIAARLRACSSSVRMPGAETVPISHRRRYVPAMRPLTTMLFDLDGTLIDSIRLILDSYHHALAEHGLPPAPTRSGCAAGYAAPRAVCAVGRHPGIDALIASTGNTIWPTTTPR